MASFKRAEVREILGEAYTEEIATKLVNLHRAVLDPLKDELDTAKSDATKYKTAAEKLPGLQQKVADLEGGENWKEKYEKEHQSFEDYKSQVARDAETAKVKAAYKSLLVEGRIGSQNIDDILGITDFSKMKLKEDGTLDGADDLKKSISEKYGRFVVSTRQRGERVDNPPKAGSGRMTKEEILAIKDTSERQKAIGENLDLFQKG